MEMLNQINFNKGKRSGVYNPRKQLLSQSLTLEYNQHEVVKCNKAAIIEVEKYGYSRDELIGDGFTAKVYKGFLLTRPTKKFAIKVINLRVLSKDQLKLIESELILHPSLDHENIVKCYDVIKTPKYIYVVLEFCPHGDLSSYIHQIKKVSEDKAIEMMEQILAGYRYLIENNILHRDLKPANILRSGNTLKIADFGFAVQGKRTILDSMNVGTPLYMPPQSIQECFYSHKSDFFALGCIMYQLVRGITPWFHHNEKILIKLMKNQKINNDQIKNFNIRDFILRSCQIGESNRMSIEQFMDFSLRKASMHNLRNNIQHESPKTKNARSFLNVTRKDSKRILSEKGTSMKSNNSETTLQSTTVIKPNEINFNDSKEEETKKITSQFEEKVQFCINLKWLLANAESCILMNDLDKRSMLIVLYRHSIFALKRILDDLTRTKAFNLCQWEKYKQSDEFKDFESECKVLKEQLEKGYNLHLKGTSLKNLSQINRKFPELSYGGELRTGFYEKLKQYMREMMANFSQEIQIKMNSSNLKSPKNAKQGENISQYFLAFKYLNIYYDYNEKKQNFLENQTQKKVKYSPSVATIMGGSPSLTILTAKHKTSHYFFECPKFPNSAKKVNNGTYGKTVTINPPKNNFSKGQFSNEENLNSNVRDKTSNIFKMTDFKQSKITHTEYLEMKKRIKWL